MTVQVINGISGDGSGPVDIAPPDAGMALFNGCPLLATLLFGELGSAQNVKIEWVVERLERGSLIRSVDYSYTQIFRTPWDPRSSTPTGEPHRVYFMREHMKSIERSLWMGHRSYNPQQGVSMMGGVYDLLGRRPQANDSLALRFLRPTQLRIYPNDYGYDIEEYLTEVTLQASRGADDREYVWEPRWLLEEAAGR